MPWPDEPCRGSFFGRENDVHLFENVGSARWFPRRHQDIKPQVELFVLEKRRLPATDGGGGQTKQPNTTPRVATTEG